MLPTMYSMHHETLQHGTILNEKLHQDNSPRRPLALWQSNLIIDISKLVDPRGTVNLTWQAFQKVLIDIHSLGDSKGMVISFYGTVIIGRFDQYRLNHLNLFIRRPSNVDALECRLYNVDSIRFHKVLNDPIEPSKINSYNYFFLLVDLLVRTSPDHCTCTSRLWLVIEPKQHQCTAIR